MRKKQNTLLWKISSTEGDGRKGWETKQQDGDSNPTTSNHLHCKCVKLPNKKRHTGQMDQKTRLNCALLWDQQNGIEDPETSPGMFNGCWTEASIIHERGRTGASVSACGKTAQPRAKEWNWTLILHHSQNMKSKWIKDLHPRRKPRRKALWPWSLQLFFFFLFSFGFDTKSTSNRSKANKWTNKTGGAASN